jgi:type IV secretory pathway VirB2 component (pilin)
MSRRVLLVIVFLALWCLPETASAIIAADDMPWSNPLARVATNLKDIIAPMAIIIGIVIFGISLAFSEHSHGFRRAVPLIVGGSIALGVIALMSAFGWSGATF